MTAPPQSFPSPIDASFTVGVVRFGGNEVIAAITVPVVCALLALFLRTRVGVAVRGTAENADRAALLGIPVRRLETLVWVIAAVLAFLSVFLRAGIVGLPIGTVLGPAILLRALAAAVIGGMERLPTIVVAAIGLGIVEQSVVWGWGQRQYVEPVLFVIVLVALLVTPAGRGLRGRIEPSTWRAVREPRPVPRELARLPEVRAAGFGLVLLVALVLVALPRVPERESHQPRCGRGDLRGDRAVVGGAHRVGRRDQPRADGVRRNRRGRRWARSPRVGGGTSGSACSARGSWARRWPPSSACRCCDGAG